MMDRMFDNSTIPVLQEVVAFTQRRHEVLAGNIANLDTPGYRTRDLNEEVFQKQLQEAIEARRAGPEHGSPGYIDDSADSTDMRDVRDSLKSILYHDDSDVSLEQQITQISKNQFMHNLAISILSSQFRLLEVAISERV